MKRIGCVLLTIALTMLMMPLMAISSSATASSIWVGGVELTDGAYLANNADEAVDVQPDGGYAHYTNGILTLCNYQYSGTGYYSEAYDCYIGVFSTQALRVVLEGENALSLNVNDEYAYGFFLRSLTLVGPGALCVDAWCVLYTQADMYLHDVELTATSSQVAYGLYSDKDIVVSACDLDVSAYYACVATYYLATNVVIEGSNLTFRSPRNAVDVHGYFYIDDSVAMFVGDAGALNVHADRLTMVPGLQVLASRDVNGTDPEVFSVEHMAEYVWMSVTNDAAVSKTVMVGGVAIQRGQYLASGAGEIATEMPVEGYAYYDGQTLTLHDYSYVGQGSLRENGAYALIACDQSLDICLEGVNQLTFANTAADVTCTAVYAGGTLYLTGGELTIDNASGDALVCDGDLYAKDAVLHFTVSGNGVVCGGYSLDFSACTFGGEAGGNGVLCDRESVYLQVLGGAVEITADACAIKAPGSLLVRDAEMLLTSAAADDDESYSALHLNDVCFEEAVVTASVNGDGQESVTFDMAALNTYDWIQVERPWIEMAAARVFVPTAGMNPTAHGIADGDRYAVDHATWSYWEAETNDFVPMPENMVFVAGETYACDVTLVSTGAYVFPMDSSLVSVSVNGRPAVSCGEYSPQSASFRVMLEAYEVTFTEDSVPMVDCTVAVDMTHFTAQSDYWMNAYANSQIHYQWYRDEAPIEGANSAVYTLQADDADCEIYVTMTCGDSTIRSQSFNAEGPVTHPGDINNDGQINMRDAFALYKAASGGDFSLEVKMRGDMNGDRVINMRDAFALYLITSGTVTI